MRWRPREPPPPRTGSLPGLWATSARGRAPCGSPSNPELRMRLGPPAFALWLLGAVGPLAAQNADCQPYTGQARVFNVCNAVIDGAQAFHPVLGLLTSGGTPVLGTATTLGGFGHVYVSARVNATRVVLPDLNYDGSTTTVGAGDKLFFPSPVL